MQQITSNRNQRSIRLLRKWKTIKIDNLAIPRAQNSILKPKTTQKAHDSIVPSHFPLIFSAPKRTVNVKQAQQFPLTSISVKQSKLH